MEGRVKRFLRRLWRAFKDCRGLINTTDVLVASGATIILAAGVAAVGADSFDQSKLAKSQSDAQALANAMTAFFRDTGKWPGQAEILAQATVTANLGSPTTVTSSVSPTSVIPTVFLITGDPSNVISGDPADLRTTFGTAFFPARSSVSTSPFSTLGAAVLPANARVSFLTSTATCRGMSREGAVSVRIAGGSVSPTGTNLLNVNDFLIRKPSEKDYPNWNGPYLQADIRSDPFDRIWLINVIPLFCAETVAPPLIIPTPGTALPITGDSTTAGNLGYAWILSGGPNRTLSTTIFNARLDPEGDDAGVNLGKLIQRTPGGRNF